MSGSEFSCVVSHKPSVSRTRRERQKVAKVERISEVKALKERVSVLEREVKTLASKLEAVQQTPILPPPGLEGKEIMESSTSHKGQSQDNMPAALLEERISILEQVYVLVDWQALEKAAKSAQD